MPIGERHRLDLIVGDVDHRSPRAARAGASSTRTCDAQRGVEVRERLVEEEDGSGLPHEARPIATRWRCPPDSSRGAIEERSRREHLGDLVDASLRRGARPCDAA
jgi:hypothetical protein